MSKRYLVVSWDAGVRTFPLRGRTDLNWPLIRECIEKTFPDWTRIFAPLEAPVEGTGKVTEVVVYESPSKDGVGRHGAMHQWLVELG